MNKKIQFLCLVLGLITAGAAIAADSCTMTCHCDEEFGCVWRSIEQLCPGGAFCQSESEQQCTVEIKDQSVPGTCIDTPDTPFPRPAYSALMR